jgi:hypothetical protein
LIEYVNVAPIGLIADDDDIVTFSTEKCASEKYAVWPRLDMISIGEPVLGGFRIMLSLRGEIGGAIASPEEMLRDANCLNSAETTVASDHDQADDTI